MSEAAAVPSLSSLPPLSSRDRILLSGKRLFARNGYENTSTVAIAREAGTSESQLMKHFGSKQGLLNAIFDAGWTDILKRVEAGQDSGGLPDRLVSALHAVVIELERDQELKELVTLEAWRVRKDNRDVVMSRGYRLFSDYIGSLLEEMKSQDLIRADISIGALRAGLLGMAEGLVRDRVLAGRSDTQVDYTFDDVRKVLDVLVPTFVAGSPHRLSVVNG
jgi:AcrR family transcriptional regulator